MDKIYLLLRNNQQTGPHNLEELAQLGLKPSDLIWIDGKSAAWRNPSEIDALKSSLPDFPEQITNQPRIPTAEKINKPTQSNIITTAKEIPIIQKHTKNIFVSLPEGFTVPAGEERSVTGEKFAAAKVSDIIEKPDTGGRPTETESTDVIEVQEEIIEGELEKRAQELLSKIQAYSQEKTLAKIVSSTNADYAHYVNDNKENYNEGQKQPLNENRDDEEPGFEKISLGDTYTGFAYNSKEEYPERGGIQQTNDQRDSNEAGFKRSDIDAKYTESFSDTKEEYPNWRKQEKIEEKKPIRRKPLLAAAVLLCVVAVGFFLNSLNGKKSASPMDDSTTIVPGEAILSENKETEHTPVTKEEPLTFQEDFLPDANFFDSQIRKDEGKIVEKTSLPNDETNAALNAAEPNKAKAEEPTIKQPVIKEPILIQPEKKEEKKVEIKEEIKPVINKKEDPAIQTSTKEPEIKKEEPSVPLTELIDIKGDYLPSQEGDGVNGYKVTMQNNSNKVLKVVAVDVFYYGANEKLLNKKTLYFSNVPPKTNMILTAPANKWAISVSHQLGLVSSEAGALYFVKQ